MERLSEKIECGTKAEMSPLVLKQLERCQAILCIPDGELFLNDKRIAIEVEFSKKGDLRFEKIINEYRKNFDIHEVWYFCANNEIKNQVVRYRASCSILKVFEVGDIEKF